MVCFCKNKMSAVGLMLPSLNVSASADLAFSADLQLMAGWLAQFGLPAAPWQPEESWLDLELPTLSLSASAMATLSAFAQLRAGALALGIDLLDPIQARAFARLAATLDARVSAMMDTSLGLSLNPGAWLSLQASLNASAQVRAALALGIFPHFPEGPPLSVWRPFLVRLRVLLPMIAVTTQLGLTASANLSVELGAMLRVMLRIGMPGVASLQMMASLTAALQAIAQIRLALGIDPLEIGLPQVQVAVQAHLSATAAMVADATGMSLPSFALNLPRLEYCATLMAPPAVVNAAMSLNLSAGLNWQIPAIADLPVLSIGLPVISLAAQLQAALGITASLSPCGPICDAGSLTAGMSFSV